MRGGDASDRRSVSVLRPLQGSGRNVGSKVWRGKAERWHFRRRRRRGRPLELFPEAANAQMCFLVNINMAVIVEAKQHRLRIAKYLAIRGVDVLQALYQMVRRQ